MSSPFLGLDPRRQLRAVPAELSPFAAYRFLAIQFGWMPNPADDSTASVASSVGCSPQDVSRIAENLQANPPVYFERNTREMIGIANTLGFKIMFMTWAHNINGDQVPPNRVPEIAEHNAITTRIAQENNVPLLDYAAIAPTERGAWLDTTHMSVQGNQQFAQTIAEFLIEQGILDASTG